MGKPITTPKALQDMTARFWTAVLFGEKYEHKDLDRMQRWLAGRTPMPIYVLWRLKELFPPLKVEESVQYLGQRYVGQKNSPTRRNFREGLMAKIQKNAGK